MPWRLRVWRCLRGVLVGKVVAEGLVVPSAPSYPPAAAAAGVRAAPIAMTASGLPSGGHINNDGSNNRDDPFFPQPVIPDKVESSAIQERIDSLRRIRGQGGCANRGVRWIPANASGFEAAASVSSLPRAVWVILFAQGSHPTLRAQRGLYCLWRNGVDSAVAFEERSGALRYAFKLKARGLGIPGPTRVAITDLQRFCDFHRFGIWIVPANSVPEPPEKIKKDLGFDPAAAAKAAAAAAALLPQQGAAGSRRETEREGRSLLTSDVVRKWRTYFEHLFAQE